MRRTLTAVLAVGGLAAGLLAAAPPAAAAPGEVVISQLYGGGGNTGAPLTNDFVELFNRSAAPVSLAGWSVQYASATGTGLFAANTAALSGTLEPGQRHLVQLGAGAGNGVPLPPPDSTGSIAMSATAGKVVLVRDSAGLACNGGSTPCDAGQLALVADLVGYGGANFFEGSGTAPTLSNTTAALRGGGGCADTDDNAADLTAGAPAPRNSTAPATPCGEPPPPPPTGCDAPATHEIAEVQGAGTATPLAGQPVRVEGVVTGDFQAGNQLSGFFVQDPTPDADPATSDGLFAFAGTSRGDVAVGDRVLVSGTAVEFNGLTELSSVTAVDVCGTGTVEALPYELPRPDGTTFEPVEGMLLTFPEPLTATEHFNLGRFGEVLLSSEGRLYEPTDGHGATLAGNAARSLLLDDASNVQNPTPVPFTSPEVLRTGDTVTGLTGVLSFGFGVYRLQPTGPVSFARTNPRPAAPAPVGGNVRVASFNTLNWFTTLGSRGATTAAERDRQLAKLVAALSALDADVVGLMEVENNGSVALSALVDALNAATAPGTYAWVDHPNPGTDAIQVAMIYKPARVRPVGDAVSSANEIHNRPPLAQTFRRRLGMQGFTVVVNHFKSKGCGGATGADLDQGDGQGCFNARRTAQAADVLAMIDTAGLRNPLLVGDLNAYAEEDPVDTLEAGGLTGLTERFVPAEARYSFVFEGRAGELDHALAGGMLGWQATGATIWHANADEPRILDYNTEFNPPDLYAPDAYRSSDHDPLVVGLCLF